MLLQRAVSAAVGVPVILGLIWLGGVGFSVAVACLLAIAALEFYVTVVSGLIKPLTLNPRLFLPKNFLDEGLAGGLAMVLVALSVAAAHNGLDWLMGTVALAILAAVAIPILRGDIRAGLPLMLLLVVSTVYIGFLGSHLVLLRGLDNGQDWVYLAVFSTFIADTASYFVGRAIGRRRLAARISPNKTIEGTVAGLLVGALGVVGLNWILGLRIDAFQVAFLAVLLPIAATIGDLGESVIKRGAGLKDTSRLIPGHGGFLDRIDALLITNALVYYYVIWVILP